MSDYITQCWNSIINTVNRMDMQQWTMVAVLVVVIGVICMRGYGSRKYY
jgi:hypothetical protein